MIHWKLAFKRFLGPGTVILLLLVLLTVSAGNAAGHQTQLRPCGVTREDDHPAAAALEAALAEKGFVIYENRQAMTADISYGTLDCGVVLLPGVGESIEAGKPGGNLLLLTAPDSFLTEAYEAHLAASLYTAAAPAMVVQSAAEAGVTLSPEQVRAELDAMYAEGWLFTFDVTTVAGTAPVQRDYGLAIAQAAAGLLLFAAIFTGTLRASQDTDRMAPRIGRKAAVRTILLPTLFWQGVCYLLAAGLPLPTRAGLPGFVLLVTALGLLAARLPVKVDAALPILLLGSLAAFPIYYDLAETIPQVALLRWILPPCWLLQTTAHPIGAAILGLAALIPPLAGNGLPAKE